MQYKQNSLVAFVLAVFFAGQAHATSILFIGNSFTFAYGSPVRYYRAHTVTDLNGQGIGGVPALFKSFTAQAGLQYDVYLETEPGISIDWHLDHKLHVIAQRPWDVVVLQGYSTLDAKKPGDATALTAAVHRLTKLLRSRNAAIDVRLMATWSRADLTYGSTGAWHGQSIDAMAHDVRTGYDLAAKGIPEIKSVIPVGEAWSRAMRAGVADSNPYDGIDAGKLNLWTYDNYHASSYGYYLEALVLFGSITGRDPRSLGNSECSGFELGFSPVQIDALEQVAFDQLTAEKALTLPVIKSRRVTAAPGKCPGN